MIIKFHGISYDVSEKYSDKDMTGQDLSNNKDMNGIVIHNSCLSNEEPNAPMLPSDLKNVTFLACNLDNVFIPPGNTVIDCSMRKFKVQNDLRDWEIDDSNKPTKILNEKSWIQQGFSVDPADIPAQFIRRERLIKADFEKFTKDQDYLSWFLGIEPKITSEETVKESKDISLVDYEAMVSNKNFYPFDSIPDIDIKEAVNFIRVSGKIMNGDTKEVLILDEFWQAMIKDKNFTPFIEQPQVIGKEQGIFLHVIGTITYVFVEGSGIFKGGEGINHPFLNSIEDLK